MTLAGRNTGEFFYVIEQPLKLLFVDDDPILREFALVHLASGRGSIAVAGDGEEALAAIARNCPDLLLLDLQMPKVNGFAVLKELRANEATRRLPVIVITARDDVMSIDRAFSEGATSFLVKPINWRQLAYQIRYVDRAHRNEVSLLEHVAEIERRGQELEATTAQLRVALRDAAAASEAKSQFLAAMSHELRTPLNAVIGFSEILKTEAFGPLGSPRYLEYAGDILSSGTHLLSLVDDVLQFSQMSLGKLTIDENLFMDDAVIGEALRIVFPQANAANVSTLNNPAGKAVAIRGDHRRVRQVLINLLSNAIKYTPAGGEVKVGAHRSTRGLTITVSDTGIGIAETDIQKVLEPFGRVENSFAREHDGVGLGLPLAKHFMALHGGSLELESTPGRGTSVAVTFPPERVLETTDAAA
jgi:signal transduction histidine kinase